MKSAIRRKSLRICRDFESGCDANCDHRPGRDWAKHSLSVSPVGPPPVSVIPVPFNLGAGRAVSACALIHVPQGLTDPPSRIEDAPMERKSFYAQHSKVNAAQVVAPSAGAASVTPADSASTEFGVVFVLIKPPIPPT